MDVTMAVKPPQQPQQQPASKGQPKLLIPDDIAKSASEPVHKGPLRNVVANAVRRWYYEAAVEASKGDTKSQALLGQMLMQGYGGPHDPENGQEWAEKARRRGYKMQGVYCEL